MANPQPPPAPQTPEQLLRSVGPQLQTALKISADASKTATNDANGLARAGRTLVPRAVPGVPNFRSLMAESLLRDGCALMDRALRHRMESDDYKAKWFEAGVQIQELLTLNEISQREEAQYSKPVDAEDTQGNADDNLAVSLGHAQTSIQQVVNDQAYLNVQPPDARAGAKTLLQSQVQQLEGQIFSSSGRSNASDLLRDYKDAMQSLQKERNSASRLTATRRALALTTPGGALNYNERMSAADGRFEDDFGAALGRLTAAAAGLQTLYEYPEALPGAQAGPFDFDSVYGWCQRATSFLAAVSDVQNTATFSFNVSSLMPSPAAFQAGRDAGTWTISIPDDAFRSRPGVRVRGVAAQVICNKPFGSWTLTLHPPIKGKYRLRSSGAFSANLIDNGQLPPLVLGRVVADRFSLPGESVSGPLVQNLSPLGTWTVDIAEFSTAQVSRREVIDVTLHFTVAHF